MFTNCPTNVLAIKKFESPGYAVSEVTDNSGAKFSLKIEVSPENFSPTQQVLNPLTVTYVATDLVGNSATCEVDIIVLGMYT